MPQTLEAPAGPVQPAVPARGGFVSLEVPSGPVRRLGPRGGAAGKIPKVALMFMLRGSKGNRLSAPAGWGAYRADFVPKAPKKFGSLFRPELLPHA